MSRNSVKLFAPIWLLLILLTAACGDGSADKSPLLAEKLQVVTTSTIVGDWVRAVGQHRVEVHSLLPTDADAHTYQPGARDIARIADADMVDQHRSFPRSALARQADNKCRASP